MATLVGLLKGTTLYDPERNYDLCLERRNLVLANMHKNGFLTEDQLNKAIKTEIKLANENEKQPEIALFFLQHIKSKVEEILDDIRKNGIFNLDPYRDGLKIYTTINSRVQRHAETALTNHLNNLQKQFNSEWTEDRWNDNKEKLIQLLKLNRYEEFEKVCSALEKNGELSPEHESLLANMKRDLTRLHAGFTCIKNTGEVLAWVGGRDFRYTQYDHVKSTR
jgi:penicillin-binding protein 1A